MATPPSTASRPRRVRRRATCEDRSDQICLSTANHCRRSAIVLTRDFFLKFILTFAAELELDRPVFIGCSMGGQVAVDLAAHHPSPQRGDDPIRARLAQPIELGASEETL